LPFPLDGRSMRLWTFRTPVGVTDTQASTPGAYFQLREAADYSESNKNLVLDLYNASGASGFGYVFFYEPLAGRTSITVTSFTMP